MRTLLVVFVLIFVFSPIHAEIYKWTDDKGTTYFTDDPETIPEKYRDQAGGRLTEEDLMSTEEKIRAKKRGEEGAKQRLMDQEKVYQRSIAEERARQLKRAMEAEKLDIRVSLMGRYVFRIEARNGGKSVKSISFMDFTLITEDNQSLSPTTGSLTRLTKIQPGTSQIGTVAFSVSGRAKTLIYNPTGEELWNSR